MSKLEIDVLAPRSSPSNAVTAQALFEWMNAQWTSSLFETSREFDTVYQNTRPYPLDVALTGFTTDAATNGKLRIDIDGERAASSESSVDPTQSLRPVMSVFATVSPGSSYRVTRGNEPLSVVWKERSVV